MWTTAVVKDDPNLYLFDEFLGCPGCAANWQKPHSVKQYGRADVSVVGFFSAQNCFYDDQEVEIENMEPDEEAYRCESCEDWFDAGHWYESQKEVNDIQAKEV